MDTLLDVARLSKRWFYKRGDDAPVEDVELEIRAHRRYPEFSMVIIRQWSGERRILDSFPVDVLVSIRPADFLNPNDQRKHVVFLGNKGRTFQNF